jgi:hypothetical protein
MSMAWVVENVSLPVADAFTYEEGFVDVSACQDGVPLNAGPPAFTR